MRAPILGQVWPGSSTTACPLLPDGGAGCSLHALLSHGGATQSQPVLLALYKCFSLGQVEHFGAGLCYAQWPLLFPGYFGWVFPGTPRPGGVVRWQWGASCFMSWAMWMYLVFSVLPGPLAHTVQPTFISTVTVSFYLHLLHQQHLLHLEVKVKLTENPFFKKHGYLKNDIKSNFLKCFLRARCPWDLQKSFPNAKSKCRSALFHPDTEINLCESEL